MAARRAATRTVPESVTRQFTRWTRPREVVFNAMVESRHPVSATDLFALIRPSHRDIGLTTVYRTLDAFATAGLVRKMRSHSGEVRFEYRRGDRDDNRGYLVCTACNKIVTCSRLEKDELEAVRRSEALLARKYGFLIRDHNIDFIGLCPDCRGRTVRRAARRVTRNSASASRTNAHGRARSKKEES